MRPSKRGKPLPDREDIEEMIARVALADRSAFNSLYSATSAKLFGVTLRILNDRAEAEEALQEAFVRIWNKAGSYNVNGLSPMTWLITVARNIAIDRKRKRKPDSSELSDTWADPSPGPEDAAITADDRSRLNVCLDKLPADHAMAVKRAYVEGATYAELAETYGVPLNTMRTWLRRSLIALRECLS